MAKTRRTHPSLDDGNGSRRERYQLRSKLPIVNTAAPPPRVTKDVSSPLSTASVATRSKKSAASTSLIPTLPPMQRDVEPSMLPKDVNSPRGEYVDIGDDDNDNNNNDDDDADDAAAKTTPTMLTTTTPIPTTTPTMTLLDIDRWLMCV